MEELRETFSYFDKTGDNTISTEDMETFLFACGLNPVKADISKMKSELGALFLTAGNSPVSFEAACSHYQSLAQKKGEMSKEELMEIFKPFDREANGHILVAEFRNIVTQLGDKLTDDEVKLALNYVETSSTGTIAYEGKHFATNSDLITWALSG